MNEEWRSLPKEFSYILEKHCLATQGGQSFPSGPWIPWEHLSHHLDVRSNKGIAALGLCAQSVYCWGMCLLLIVPPQSRCIFSISEWVIKPSSSHVWCYSLVYSNSKGWPIGSKVLWKIQTQEKSSMDKSSKILTLRKCFLSLGPTVVSRCLHVCLVIGYFGE